MLNLIVTLYALFLSFHSICIFIAFKYEANFADEDKSVWTALVVALWPYVYVGLVIGEYLINSKDKCCNSYPFFPNIRYSIPIERIGSFTESKEVK